MRVAHCNLEVPLVFSNPHFYQASNHFRSEIKGFKPVKELHESFADLSKELGMVINGRKTVQLNLDTSAYHYYMNRAGKSFEREIFPVFWLADTGKAGASSIFELKEELYDKVENIKKYLIIFIAIFIAGCIVPIIYLVVDFTLYFNVVDDRQLIGNSDDSFSNNRNNNEEERLNEKTEHRIVNQIDHQSPAAVNVKT